MNIAPAPTPRPPAAPNQPPSAASGQAAAAIPPRPCAEPELAVVAVLGYN